MYPQTGPLRYITCWIIHWFVRSKHSKTIFYHKCAQESNGNNQWHNTMFKRVDTGRSKFKMTLAVNQALTSILLLVNINVFSTTTTKVELGTDFNHNRYKCHTRRPTIMWVLLSVRVLTRSNKATHTWRIIMKTVTIIIKCRIIFHTFYTQGWLTNSFHNQNQPTYRRFSVLMYHIRSSNHDNIMARNHCVHHWAFVRGTVTGE